MDVCVIPNRKKILAKKLKEVTLEKIVFGNSCPMAWGGNALCHTEVRETSHTSEYCENYFSINENNQIFQKKNY